MDRGVPPGTILSLNDEGVGIRDYPLEEWVSREAERVSRVAEELAKLNITYTATLDWGQPFSAMWDMEEESKQ